MPLFSPYLPRHYSISAEVRAEIAALSADLDLQLVSQSHSPILGPLDCIQVERTLVDGLGFACRFKLDKSRQAVDIDKARALCVALCVRNHKRYRKNVYSSDNYNSRVSLFRD